MDDTINNYRESLTSAFREACYSVQDFVEDRMYDIREAWQWLKERMNLRTRFEECVRRPDPRMEIFPPEPKPQPTEAERQAERFRIIRETAVDAVYVDAPSI